ncbi:MAG: hypothetical protein CL908_21180 [Deltaproteobacteria bacterium]|nr:hypothetical protein [Deltaproteobacteria bacterium]
MSIVFGALGIACVAWTTLELVRMRDVSVAQVPASKPSPASGQPSPRRFAAWDDEGRRICVEDLGHP